MEFHSSTVMAYILYKAKQEDHPISKTQAQKLLYCCYGLVMAAFNERLTDDHPKAWPSGPLFPRTVTDIDKGRITVGMAEDFINACPADCMKLINETITRFWDYTGLQLSNWTKMKNSPWTKADPLAALDDREIGIFFKPYIKVVETKTPTIHRIR